MNYSVELRDKASEEFIDAFLWYEEQRIGLGDLFERAVQNKLKHICSHPLHYKISYKNFHEASVATFPFLIIYAVDEKLKHITVIAIFHTSRHPKKKFKK